ncbi:uncharacterized protein CIMG_12954 [Coccidioides immitis RS]|uniref:Uncharacterized protein n=1 Tax=Coccidioides immitis (strain RS) TaxID=246410 RepID=J3K316_COCIM|nr:uncharacterized protein CIMG_12954 [Coccidioides immitis RS]EAS28531.3 hypothetical protein CIMG_12954 [Coccidioides immitis RS]
MMFLYYYCAACSKQIFILSELKRYHIKCQVLLDYFQEFQSFQTESAISTDSEIQEHADNLNTTEIPTGEWNFVHDNYSDQLANMRKENIEMNESEILLLESATASNLSSQEDLVISDVDTGGKRECTESTVKRSSNFYILVSPAKLSVIFTTHIITYKTTG